jgi:putative ABC transport system permease protein
MSRADRIFRRLLRLFPAEFRGDFGDDMAADFRDQRQDVLARGGIMDAIRLWLDTLRGILTTAPAEHWDLLRQDVRYALRNLARNPGFAVVASLALAVGIGANAAVFSLVNGVLIRPLPYADPDALVTIFEKVPGAPVDKFEFSPPDFEILHDTARSYTGMFAYRNGTFELSGVAESQRVIGTRVSPDIFSVLGVAPALGRAITAEDDRSGGDVVVLTHGLWTRAFGRDPAIVGRTITLDRKPYTVVGVMPPPFEFPPRGAVSNGEPGDFYMPMAFSRFERQAFGAMYNNSVVARLKPGVSIAQARAELASLVPTLAERYPPVLHQMALQLSLPMSRFMDEIVGQSRRMILVLMGAVGMVLLIGCVDVANLVLTRASGRRRELAVRAALGASPVRVVRQLVTEGLVLAGIGGTTGLVLAWWATDALLSLAGTSLPRAESIHFDTRAVLFAMGLSLVTPLLFGVMPALRSAMQSTFEALKDSSRAATPGRGRHRLLGSLVVAQFALALMLSVGAGLLVRSFVRLLQIDPGFRPEHVVTASVTLPPGRYTTGPQIKEFYQAAVDAARSIPGVAAAGAGTDRPLRIRERRVFTPDATAVRTPTLNRSIAATWTAGSYFDTLGLTLVRGRFFTDADGRRGERVVIISEMMAKKLWPGADPIGRQIKWGIDESRAPWMTVVGVVGDANQGALGTSPIPQTYEPIDQQPNAPPILAFYREVNVLVRSDRDAAAVVGALRGALQRLDPALPVSDAGAVTDVVLESVKPQRFSMMVVTLFAAVALGLAAIGIYGVLANAVSQQTHEIGVRMALGARRSAVLWWVLGRALRLMAIGAVVGIAGALMLTRVMSGLLYEVRPTDAVTFAASSVLLAALALVAGLVPAWRATRVDPLVALRSE